MADSDKYKCKECGAIHGGVYSPNVCKDCWAKAIRRRFRWPALSAFVLLVVVVALSV